MSSTGRSNVRIVNDFYPTPRWPIRRLFEVYSPPPGNWLEPGAGNGSIIRSVNILRPTLASWTAVELRRQAYIELFNLDVKTYITDYLTWARQYRDAKLARFKVAIGNPPYSLAEEFIRASLEISDEVIFLLRLNYLGSDKRSIWLGDNPPDVLVLPNRVSGTQDGHTDSTEYAWFIWRREQLYKRILGGIGILKATPLKERQEDYK